MRYRTGTSIGIKPQDSGKDRGNFYYTRLGSATIRDDLESLREKLKVAKEREDYGRSQGTLKRNKPAPRRSRQESKKLKGSESLQEVMETSHASQDVEAKLNYIENLTKISSQSEEKGKEGLAELISIGANFREKASRTIDRQRKDKLVVISKMAYGGAIKVLQEYREILRASGLAIDYRKGCLITQYMLMEADVENHQTYDNLLKAARFEIKKTERALNQLSDSL